MNNKLEKVLVAIDFSEPSLNALETAAAIAQKNKADILIIYVQDNLFKFMGAGSMVINSVTNNSFSILTALDIQTKAGITPKIIEESGHPTEVILKTVIDERCDLVVMGTYGASGYRNGYIGSMAYSLVKFTPCPVLLVPSERKWLSFTKPLFPIRSGITLLRHFDIIRQFAGHAAIVDVFALSEPGRDSKVEQLEEIVADLERRLSADKIIPRVERNTTGSVARKVLLQIDNCKSDLVIITPAIDVSAKQFYIGPNMHYIINNSKVPVLIINRVNIYAYMNPA